MVGLWLLMGIFIVWPLAMLLLRAFHNDGHLSIVPLLTAVENPVNLRALRNSLVLASLVGIAGTVIGLVFAFTAERANLTRRTTRLIDIATLLPLISPPFTTSIAFVFLFGHAA